MAAVYYKVLKQDGEYLLLETGDKILLENYFYETKTVTAKSRVKLANIAKTIQAKARVEQVDITKTVQAKSRVKIIGITKTVEAKQE